MSTPIFDRLISEEHSKALTTNAREAFQRIIDAFRPFVEYVTAIAKALQRYDMSAGQPVRRPGMKPLLKNGRKP